MKPLFTGFYCPKDCDRPHLRAKALDEEIKKAQDAMARPRITANPNVWGFSGMLPYRGAVPAAPAVQLADDECRDFFCNGKGKTTHTTITQGWTTQDVHYQCGTCSKTWFVTKPVPKPTGVKIP
jgi:hypothetical protein